MKTVLLSTILLLMCSIYMPDSRANVSDDVVLEPIHLLFDGMREHNGEKILAQFTAAALLQRVQADGTVKNADLTAFADYVSKSKQYLDEQIFGLKIHRQGNLATVWAPFALYVDNQLSHCGVNSFQLIKTNKKWKIQYLIDNKLQGDCDEFRLTFAATVMSKD